jgi:nitrate reductase NapE component
MTSQFNSFLDQRKTKQQTLIQRAIGLTNSIAAHIKFHVVTLGLVVTSVAFMTSFGFVYWADSTAMPLLLRLDCGGVNPKWLIDCHVGLLAGYGTELLSGTHVVLCTWPLVSRY